VLDYEFQEGGDVGALGCEQFRVLQFVGGERLELLVDDPR
jgi:hypothetical protein